MFLTIVNDLFNQDDSKINYWLFNLKKTIHFKNDRFFLRKRNDLFFSEKYKRSFPRIK